MKADTVPCHVMTTSYTRPFWTKRQLSHPDQMEPGTHQPPVIHRQAVSSLRCPTRSWQLRGSSCSSAPSSPRLDLSQWPLGLINRQGGYQLCKAAVSAPAKLRPATQTNPARYLQAGEMQLQVAVRRRAFSRIQVIHYPHSYTDQEKHLIWVVPDFRHQYHDDATADDVTRCGWDRGGDIRSAVFTSNNGPAAACWGGAVRNGTPPLPIPGQGCMANRKCHGPVPLRPSTECEMDVRPSLLRAPGICDYLLGSRHSREEATIFQASVTFWPGFCIISFVFGFYIFIWTGASSAMH